jgi:hypothetical protein
MAQRFEALFSKSDEDHAAEQAELVSQQAYDTAEECAVGASEVEANTERRMVSATGILHREPGRALRFTEVTECPSSQLGRAAVAAARRWAQSGGEPG